MGLGSISLLRPLTPVLGRLSADEVEPNENLGAALIRLDNSCAPEELQGLARGVAGALITGAAAVELGSGLHRVDQAGAVTRAPARRRVAPLPGPKSHKSERGSQVRAEPIVSHNPLQFLLHWRCVAP
jgi:hypothetical protein